MLLIFAEILLLALAPTQQESTRNTNTDGVGQQKVQWLLQNFYEQYFNPTETEFPEEITERISRAEPVISLRNANNLAATPSVLNNVRNPSVAPRPRLLDASPTERRSGSGFLRTPVVRGRLAPQTPTNAAIVVEPSRNPQPRFEEEEFIFAPSSGRGNTGGTGWGETPIPSNGIEERCESPKVFLRSKCHALLTQGPCASDEWVVEINGQPECSKTKCHWPRVPMNGQCYDYTTLTYSHFQNCPPGMTITVNRDGTVECDCLPRYLYHTTSGSCFEAFRKGPCNNSQYFVPATERSARLPDGRSTTPAMRATCMDNPCKADGMVCLGSRCSTPNPQKNCVPLNSPCQNGNRLVMVDSKEFQVACADPENEVDPRVIGNVPNFECSKGSKRDISGRCRKTTTMTFS